MAGSTAAMPDAVPEDPAPQSPKPFKLRDYMPLIYREATTFWKKKTETDDGLHAFMVYIGRTPMTMPRFDPSFHTGKFVMERFGMISEIKRKIDSAIVNHFEYDHRLEVSEDSFMPTREALETDNRTRGAALAVRQYMDMAVTDWNALVKAQKADRQKMVEMHKKLKERRNQHKILRTPIMKNLQRLTANAFIHKYEELGRLLIDQLDQTH
tara:strand:+ start:1760 stop:2392 length:633 start_codon:yes stop_codon:yes gene_type:complete